MFVNLFFCLSLAIGFIFITAAQPPYGKYESAWSDEFEIDGLPNSKDWGYERGCSVRNNELQYYAEAREKNSRVENGFLIIEAHREPMNGCNYTSANIRTMGKRSFKYGLFEIRAKIDIRKGSWPAWWWLPNSGGWPKGGEIDMMEYYQGKCLFNVMDGNQRWTSKTKAVDANWAEQFHIWTMEWDSLKINIWLDGVLMNSYNVSNADGTGPNGENPFRRPGYMLINQAIGGNNGGDPSGTTFPVRLIVDYVRHYMGKKDSVNVILFSNPAYGYIKRNELQPPQPLPISLYSIDGRVISPEYAACDKVYFLLNDHSIPAVSGCCVLIKTANQPLKFLVVK